MSYAITLQRVTGGVNDGPPRQFEVTSHEFEGTGLDQELVAQLASGEEQRYPLVEYGVQINTEE